jgi:prepilin signal peptidase PulO-like enzyme (type II secretory pathway)
VSPHALAALGWGVAGLVLGDFLTLVIARLPAGEAVWRPPSRCPRCRRRLGAIDLVPVLGYLLARGRCRRCGAPIGAWYPAVELTAGAGCAALAWLLFPQPRLYPALLLWLVGIAASWIDVRARIIPNRLLLAGAAALAVLLAFDGPGAFVAAVEGAALFLAFALALALLSRGGMGMGDVKYLTLVGGALGPGAGLVALYATMAAGGLYAAALLAAHRARRGTRIAFAPFIAAGSMAGALLGPQVVRWHGG